MMKLKVKITGWSEGKRCSFKTEIETPNFVEHEVEFLQRKWLNTVLMQQTEWLDDNYESIIVLLAEERWYWPIEGYEVVARPVKKKSKKDQVFEILDQTLVDTSDEFKALFLGSLHAQWKTVKDLSAKKIVEIVLNTINVSTTTSAANWKEVLSWYNKKDKQISE